MQWREPFHVLHTVIETWLLANQSSHFQNGILYVVFPQIICNNLFKRFNFFKYILAF